MRSKFQTSTLRGSEKLNLRKHLKFGGLNGGPVATRTPDLYRVKVNISITYRAALLLSYTYRQIDWTPF